jgi:chromosome segregation ATPase
MTDYITYPQEQETQTVEPQTVETQPSPSNEITEQNMREYFERLINHVVGLTSTAQKVDELTQRVNDMQNRIYGLEVENDNLKQDLQTQIETVNQVRAQHDAVELELHNSREHTHALAETIVMRDKRVAELDQTRQDAEDHFHEAEQELLIAQNRISDQEALINDLRLQLQTVTEDRDAWKKQAYDFEEEVIRVKTNLERIQAILNPPRPVESHVTEPVADVA